MGELAHVSPLSWVREAVAGRRDLEAEPPPFAELVLLHYLRQLEVFRNRNYDGAHEQPYQEKLKAFTRANGRIVDAYWCTREPSGLALTEWSRRSWRQPWKRDNVIRLHAETDWITRDVPEVADEIHRCQALAVKVSEVLRGTSELIALQWLLVTIERLLGLVDQTEQRPIDEKVLREAVAHNEQELKDIRRYYDKAAENQARLVYFHGMMQGAFWLAVFVGLVTLVLYAAGFGHWGSPATQDILLAVGMGGVGAIISVMSRMAGKGAFAVDHEVGRKTVRRLGSFRPFIGATFAVALYFGFASNLVQLGTVEKTIYFYAIVSFLAGFSERWARVLLDSAGGGAAPKR